MDKKKAVLSNIGHSARNLIRTISNKSRLKKTAPDYVYFILDGSYPELSAPRTQWWHHLLPSKDDSLQALSGQFEVIAEDPRVQGVVLHLRPLMMPLAHLQTLRGLIKKLREAGKRVVVWSHSYDTATYYVACAADEIILQPGGGLAPLGLNREFVFLADTLEQLGIEVEAVQITPYKSSPDMFTRQGLSEEAREMMTWLTDDTYADIIEAIAKGRNISPEEASALIDHAPYTDFQARDGGVVDMLLHEEDLPTHLASPEEPATLESWESAQKVLLYPPMSRSERYVALLRIEGAIIAGKSRSRPPFNRPLPLPFTVDEQAGDLSVVQAARALRDNEDVGAVVVFIESPGGSATASEAIAAALDKLAAEKPLVAIMGSVAASGGYYVATPANWIMAQPGTLTGSIGVFMMKGVTEGLLKKLRLHTEKITRGKNASLYSSNERFTDEEREIIVHSMQRTYDLFLERVANSRKMTTQEADTVGGGRVWTGRQAKERGLVDQLGGLEDAFAKARQLGELSQDAPVRELIMTTQYEPPQ
ncbi:MAG: signal peptide peptidase SppA [Ardenticatenaceae bacterium]